MQQRPAAVAAILQEQVEAAISQAEVRTRVEPVAAVVSQAEQVEAADSPEVDQPVVVEAEEPFADKKKRARWRSFFIASLPRGT